MLTKIAIACLAVAAVSAAVSQQCKEDFAAGSKCYVNKADGIVHENAVNVDLDQLDECISRISRKCGDALSNQLGADYASVPEDKLQDCADESMGGAQDKIQSCLTKKFPGVQFGTKQEQKNSDGLRLIVLLGTLKQTYKTCRDITECVPQNYAAIKKQLCGAQSDCFPNNYERSCSGIDAEVASTTCQCYKQIPNKENIKQEFDTCVGIGGPRSLLGFVGGRVASGGIVSKIEKDLCSNRDYTKKYGVCEDDELERATKTNSALNTFGQLLGGGRGNSGSNSGNSNSGGGGNFWSRFGNFGRK